LKTDEVLESTCLEQGLVFFTCIHTDDMTASQVIWVASACSISLISSFVCQMVVLPQFILLWYWQVNSQTYHTNHRIAI